MIGRVKSYNPNRAYGFVHTPTHGDIFLHVTALVGDSLVSPGDLVTFDVQSTAKGWRALGVTLLHPPTVRGPKSFLAARAEREAQALRDVAVGLGLPEEAGEEKRRNRWRRE